ncbi:VCBS repeat-containing protein [Chryseolinea sp. H1M3-3]|uniref:FG-GAP repeat domain-containing protein n=1 Tax=Chryseolinea sp. H1M3-3 TaxID=3034144 RepID=UPI0023EBBDEA|nr:VCBS repeat-containing protein [Chryseolinea sp. H1M3-3]
MKIFHCVLAIIFLSILSCENQQQKGKRLAKQACSSCHAFPDPSLLDKKTWEKKVLPEMAFRMGLDYTPLERISLEDQSVIVRVLPQGPMISEEDWQLIKQYYNESAPDTLIIPDRIINDTIKQFEITALRLPIAHHQSITLIEHDSVNDRLYIGNRPGKLYKFNTKFEVKDSLQLSSSPAKIIPYENSDPLVLLMGIMDPNEQSAGNISRIENQKLNSMKLIDSLQRPVDFEGADLNNDWATDYVVCNFGNYTGALVAYEGLENGKFKKYILQNLPGARKVILKDFDGNGMTDIMALMTQGDERIIMLYNQGNFQFRVSTLLRFNPVDGSSYFEIADFNKDGKFDILYTNGDNADYSPILKPYHGVHIFLNSGANDFKESWFYPMHGASQARAADFDKDGDIDIAAISFFPDFKNHPDHSLIYFENTPNGFAPQITPLASKGRWITMELTDYDYDGDQDVLLGSLAFPTQIPTDLLYKWRQDKISLLVLRNKLK